MDRKKNIWEKLRKSVSFKTFVLFIGLILIFGALSFVNGKNHKNNNEEQTNKIVLKIEASGNTKKYQESFKNRKNLFELMKKISLKENFDFNYKESSSGVFLKSINGVKNNPRKNMFWMYYINGELSSLGASNCFINDGDVVLWKYQDTSKIEFK